MRLLKVIAELNAQKIPATIKAIALATGQDPLAIYNPIAELLMQYKITPSLEYSISSHTEYFLTNSGRNELSRKCESVHY